ncbi:MAG: hypothetical protein LAO09_08910 [Acidobacteriia bacterium]|nr:hypothetical protein [Terriglobia bacterium]
MELDSYERLKLAAAKRLQPWHEHREGGSCHIWVAGLTLNLGDINEEEQERVSSMIDYPRLCSKNVTAKHLGITVPQLKKLLGDWGYEHVCKDKMYPNSYTQLVIVKTALLCAERMGVTARIPVPQETACERYSTMWVLKDAKGRSLPCPIDVAG